VKSLRRAYDALIEAGARIGAGLVGLVFLAIVYDVSLRSVGFKPPAWTSALSEYALLYLTMLAAPWLVRHRGHVTVESFIVRLPWRIRAFLEKVIYVACIALCLGLAYYSTLMAIDSAMRGELDIRSIEIPRWVLFAPLLLGFVFCAVEFGRYLFGSDSLYASQGATLPADMSEPSVLSETGAGDADYGDERNRHHGRSARPGGEGSARSP
jgi:TRAP-type C4-dicarboxylate transport system permease small subunit